MAVGALTKKGGILKVYTTFSRPISGVSPRIE
jgi:hypothetical protein